MNNNADLSIVIPCFNETKNITLVLTQLNELIDKQEYFIEVIVIDGGSTDNTPQELTEFFSTLPDEHFKLILNQERGGYGGDIMKAVSTARGQVLSWTHADLQTDPGDVLKAYEKYLYLTKQNEKIFIKGERKNRRMIEAFFTFGMQIVAFLALKLYLDDINAQPKLFSREFYAAHLREKYPTDFSLDLYALYQAKKNGYQVHTIPVYFKERIHGEAKGGGGGWRMKINLIKRTFKYIFELRKTV